MIINIKWKPEKTLLDLENDENVLKGFKGTERIAPVNEWRERRETVLPRMEQ